MRYGRMIHGVSDVPLVSRLRIFLTYTWRHRRFPRLSSPRTFTELVQYRKMHDRDPCMPGRADKVLVKDFVMDELGNDWITPTLWHGTDLPETPPWPRPFVLKSRHGCNQIAFIDDDNVHTWADIRKRAMDWLDKTYGYWLDEWAYENIAHGLLVEPYIGTGDRLPVDYKFYVFGGKVTYVQVHLDRKNDHRWILLSPDWTRVSARTRDSDPVRPVSLPQMIEAAEALGRDFDFVRTDFYECGGQPVFGEMTFYPGSGLDPFDPPELDAVIGSHWLRARACGNDNVTIGLPGRKVAARA